MQPLAAGPLCAADTTSNVPPADVAPCYDPVLPAMCRADSATRCCCKDEKHRQDRLRKADELFHDGSMMTCCAVVFLLPQGREAQARQVAQADELSMP